MPTGRTAEQADIENLQKDLSKCQDDCSEEVGDLKRRLTAVEKQFIQYEAAISLFKWSVSIGLINGIGYLIFRFLNLAMSKG